MSSRYELVDENAAARSTATMKADPNYGGYTMNMEVGIESVYPPWMNFKNHNPVSGVRIQEKTRASQWKTPSTSMIMMDGSMFYHPTYQYRSVLNPSTGNYGSVYGIEFAHLNRASVLLLDGHVQQIGLIPSSDDGLVRWWLHQNPNGIAGLNYNNDL